MSTNETNDQPANISDLQENFSVQQEKISALKDLVRKSGVAHEKSTSSAQEKVKSIAQRLTHLKTKARSRQNLNVTPQADVVGPDTSVQGPSVSLSLSQSELSIESPAPSRSSTPNATPQSHKPPERSTEKTPSQPAPAIAFSNEKVMLLRQQMEQNKLRMAQRASSKQHLEQLVTQLKERFDTTQQCLEDTTELGKSMSDLSAMIYAPSNRERHKSATDLTTPAFSLEKERIKFLENRCRMLEKQLEKERQLNNGHSRSLSLNPSGSSQALDNKITEMEQALVERQKQYESKESELAAENARLKSEIELKQAELERFTQESRKSKADQDQETQLTTSLEITDLVAENERLKMQIEDHLKGSEEQKEVIELLEAARCDLTSRTNELEEELKQVQSELVVYQEKLSDSEGRWVVLQESLDKHQVPSSAQDEGVDTDAQVKAEMAKQIQELMDELNQLRRKHAQLQETLSERENLVVSDVTIAEKISSLEATIESQREQLSSRDEALCKKEEELMEKTIELNVLNANFKVLEDKLQASSKSKSLFTTSGGPSEAEKPELHEEIQHLKQKLDESNKAMIKLKLKCKQSDKQIEKLKKGSDLHAEVVRLGAIREELQQRITELEDEKGQWQLLQVERETPEALKVLQEQNEQLSKALRAMEERLGAFEAGDQTRVKNELSQIQLEEQLADLTGELKSSLERLSAKEAELEECKDKVEELQIQKDELNKKLEHYLTENMELLDKVEKLSKSSSSAESIEIVERLTQQERAEIDEFNKRLVHDSSNEPTCTASVSELTQTDMGPELNESLAQLREESSELMSKIELFTTERREVLAKMEHLNAENQDLLKRIEELSQEKLDLETKLLLADHSKAELETQVQNLTKEKNSLAVRVAESSVQKAQLSQELSSLQQSSEVVAALDDGATLFEKCEKSLSKLNAELEAYRKANDNKAKFNVSKKLAKEAENAHTQLSELLQKVKEASSAVETVTVVETVVAVTAPNGKALAEYEQLTAQNRDLKATIVELRRLLDEARELPEDGSKLDKEQQHTEVASIVSAQTDEQLSEARAKIAEYEKQCAELKSVVEGLTTELQEARTALNEKSNQISQLDDELVNLRKMSEEFDRLINDKEMSYEKQVEQLTRLRRELESKCETYEGEIEILQTLVTEQKQQLIEAYKENEHEMNLKLLELQEREQEASVLRVEIAKLKESSISAGAKLSENLQAECEKLRETLRINKVLVAEQVNELSNKQETIDTLNQQIIDLYKTMEENANKVVEKEDEIVYLQEVLDANKQQMAKLQSDYKQLTAKYQELEQQSGRREELLKFETNREEIVKLESNYELVQEKNRELEQRNKEQLEKLKKYAANLKKRSLQCAEYEKQLRDLEQSAQHTQHLDKENNEKLDKLQSYNEDLQERIKEVERKVEEKNTELSKMKEELVANNDIRASLETELERLRTGDSRKQREKRDVQSPLVAAEGTDMDSLRKDLASAQENLDCRIKEIAELKQALSAAHKQLSDWSSGSSVKKNADYENLVKVLADKTASLEKAESMLEDVQNELLQLREREHESSQKIAEMSSELREKEERITELKEKQTNHRNGELVSALQEQIEAQEHRISEMSAELKTKAIKFEKSKAVIKERNGQIHRLQAQLKDLQEKLSALPEEEILSPVTQTALSAPAPASSSLQDELNALKESYRKLNEKYSAEKSVFEQTTNRLETLHDGIQAKLQQEMLYAETLEEENAKFKDKINKLEECVATFEERRTSMEHRANLMDAQMQTRDDEHAKSEDELIYRLNMLLEHEEVIAQRLIASQNEKEQLEERAERLQTQFNTLQAEHKELERQHNAYKSESVAEFERNQSLLKEQLTKVEADMERLRAVYDGKLAAKTTEIDELECELSDQLQKMNSEKWALSEELERTCDELAKQKDEIVRLNESLNTLEQAKSELERETTWLRMQNENSQQDLYELQELRIQIIQEKTEIENLHHQIESLSANHESELQALRLQISELDSLRMQVGQNQTDDQVFIETENKRLTDLLAEKEALIENYQRQNLQLQMAAAASTASSASQPDPFALAFGLPTPTPNVASGSVEEERLEKELNEKNALITRLQQDLNNLQSEFNVLLEGNNEMQRLLAERSQEGEGLRTLQSGPAMLAAQSNDVIPAPPMFFTSDSMVRSPFDEIVQTHVTDNEVESHSLRDQRGDVVSSSEHPTIEDLQRNVSDLEKHAQDLEHKLAMRNQRDSENEERLREALRDLESQLQERELLLQQTQEELRVVKEELSQMSQKQTEADAMAMQLEQLQSHVKYLETMLQERDEALARLRSARLGGEHLQSSMATLESQIVPDEPTLDASIQPTLDMFFGNPPAGELEEFVLPQVSSEPVVEEIIVPKKAYVCHPNEPAPPGEPLKDLDLGDGWGEGWSNNEAAAEAEHFAKQSAFVAEGQPSLVPREQQLELQLQEQSERSQELQLALDRCEEQKKELHIKCGKLMKKLKEYKVKMDETHSSVGGSGFRKSSSTEPNSMFSELDAAIQEELKAQITNLEAKLEEQRKLQESSQVEREKLLKRIDVLTAGNERMSEMKERQDMDVQMYQARIRELQQRLDKLEDWGTESGIEQPKESALLESTRSQVSLEQSVSEETQKQLEERISALTAEVVDINGDKQELQALLDEEKANTARLEATVESLRQELGAMKETSSMDKSIDKSRYNDMKLELQNLQDTYNSLLSTNNSLTVELKAKSDSLSNSEAQELKLRKAVETLKTEMDKMHDSLKSAEQSLRDAEKANSDLKADYEAKLLGTGDIENLKLTLDSTTKEKEQLRSQKQSMEEQIKDLQRQVEKHLETSVAAQNREELSAQLQEKESEIMHLKQRVNDLMNEDQTEKLVLEILTKNQEIHMLKVQVKNLEDEKQELEHNLSLQITKQMQESKEKTQQEAPGSGNRLQQLELQVEELLAEKSSMEQELQVLNNHVMESLGLEDKMKAAALELDAKNIEIAELRKSLESVKANVGNVGDGAQVDFVTLNAQWEAIVDQRCGEIAKMWQEHLAQRERDFKETEARLNEEITELRSGNIVTFPEQPQHVLSVETTITATSTTTSTSTPASASTTASGISSEAASKAGTPLRVRSEEDEASADAIIEKMQAALESQEMEIVTLKEQLAIRSAEYARLAAQYDPFKLQDTLSHSGMSTTAAIGSPEARRTVPAATGDMSLVPKSELDLALYMLHQRDMRCEEMTVELVSLLEERDTLQLKLSNTLRQVEAIKAQANLAEAPSSEAAKLAASPVDAGNASTIVAGSTIDDSTNELNQKLSQLQTVNYSKDKVIKEEREQRIRQMEKIQQDVAKMPPAAVSELIGSDFSQTGQSPSSVLLNWLWGNQSGSSGGAQPNL